jgi:hypothetical protein
MRFRHARHLFGYAVGFLFVDVSRNVDREFRPKPDGRFGVHGYPAELVSEGVSGT